MRATQTDAAAAVLGSLAQRDAPLGARTSYRVGGTAALFVQVGEQAALEVVAKAVALSGVDVLIVGNGSNLLVADAGFPGLVVALGSAFETLEFEGDDAQSGEVRAGGALSLPVLARRSATAGRHGLEWAVGVPGSVGGAVAMNAGGHGSDIASCLSSARVFSLRGGRDVRYGVAELAYSYRHSALAADDVVLEASFHTTAGEAATALGEIDEIVRWRREHQPGGRNAGSVFTNPAGDSAGRLIDAAGLKGLRVGSAEVSEKHANFFQVDAEGSSDDVRRLIDEVRRLVAERFGVELATEVRMIGFER